MIFNTSGGVSLNFKVAGGGDSPGKPPGKHHLDQHRRRNSQLDFFGDRAGGAC